MYNVWYNAYNDELHVPYFLKFSRDFDLALNFVVGLGLRKLSARNFLHTRKFWSRGIHYHLHAM